MTAGCTKQQIEFPKWAVRLPSAKRSGPSHVLPYLPETEQWKYIIIHHSATERGNARVFDKGHRLRGFQDGLGYHFVIGNGTYGTMLGQIEIGDRWYKQLRGAHCRAMGMNEVAIGICLVGNFNKKGVPREELDSAVWLVKNLQQRYRIPKNHILRHKDAKRKGTDCPGHQFPWLNFLQKVS
jgi:N-acetyl-anhydromuramyl-L-alanine amidase AmpD